MPVFSRKPYVQRGDSETSSALPSIRPVHSTWHAGDREDNRFRLEDWPEGSWVRWAVRTLRGEGEIRINHPDGRSQVMKGWAWHDYVETHRG